MEGESGQQGAAKRSMLRVNGEARHAGAIKNAQNYQQRHQTGHNTGKAHQVKLAAVELAQTAPALERPGGNQEAGNYKENAHAIIAAPEQHPIGRRANPLAKRALVEMNAEV